MRYSLLGLMGVVTLAAIVFRLPEPALLVGTTIFGFLLLIFGGVVLAFPILAVAQWASGLTRSHGGLTNARHDGSGGTASRKALAHARLPDEIGGPDEPGLRRRSATRASGPSSERDAGSVRRPALSVVREWGGRPLTLIDRTSCDRQQATSAVTIILFDPQQTTWKRLESHATCGYSATNDFLSGARY